VHTGYKESAKLYINKTAHRMIELTTNSQGSCQGVLASSQSSHFDDEVKAYEACLC
jgi:hypothetical protein